MKETGRSGVILSLIGRYISILIVVWSMLVASSLVFNIFRIKKETVEVARLQANISYEKDMVYRRWNARHGGVYVPVTEDTPASPFLSGVAERDVTTPSGRVLTLVNPAYMTRQVYDLMEAEFGVRGHITSLKPINPANSPDSWEADALRRCERGESGVGSVSRIDGREYFRLMNPFVIETGCLKCHGKEGYEKGDVRGGISVSIPMAPMSGMERGNIARVSLVHSLLWLVGMTGLTWSRKHLEQREQEGIRFVEDLEKEKVTAQTYLDIAAVMFLALDNRQTVTMINSKGCKCIGLDETEILGRNWFDNFVPEAGREQARALFTKSVSGYDVLPEYIEHSIVTGNGEERLIAWHNIIMRDERGNIVGTLSSGEDITERKSMEEALRRSVDELELRVRERTAELSDANTRLRMSSEHLRSLFVRLQSARESERDLLSREIHDEFGTVLTALKIDLSWLEKKLEGDEAARARLRNDMGFVTSAIREVQRISTELRPGMLDHLGLAAAVEWQVKESAGRAGLEYDLSLGLEGTPINRDLSTALFRIFQEILTNVVRHARAKKVSVTLAEKDGELVLSVVDDGVGISGAQISNGCSLGLAGIRESVRAFGGRIEISGVRNEGTSVLVSMPMETAHFPGDMAHVDSGSEA